MAVTFAIAHPNTPKIVSIWCNDEGKMKDGSRKFSVINGAWKGYLFEDNTLLVERTGARLPAIVVWEGEVPITYKRSFGYYNEAIHWIEEQIK